MEARNAPMFEDALPGLPFLDPEAISWAMEGSDHIELHIDLENLFDEPTMLTTLVVEKAPLGAFLPYRPAARLFVPILATLETKRITARIPVDDVPDLNRASEWGGSLRLYYEGAEARAVEVHRCRRLLVVPSRTTRYDICLPATDDRYRLRAISADPEWTAEVDRTRERHGPYDLRVLTVHSPVATDRLADIEVEVQRRYDGAVATLEFELMTGAGRWN